MRRLGPRRVAARTHKDEGPVTPRLEDRVIRGVPWATLSFGAGKVISVATTFVLARLLAPADFGVVALALLAVGVLTVVGNLGLSGVLVLRVDLDERGKGTVLSLMLAMSVVLAVAVVLFAPLAASIFEEPRLRSVLVVLALFVLPSGVTWFYEAIIQRELEFRSRFVAQAVQSCTFAVVSVGSAVAGLGVWSLVAGQVASVTVYAAVLLAVTPERVRPAFDRGQARAIVAAGRGFLAQGGLAFLKQNTDYIVVGRLLGAAPLGFYSVAYRLGELPFSGIADPVARVTFPAFARMRARDEEVTPAFLSVLQAVALVACPLGVILSGAADPFTRAVLGERWLPLVAPLTVLGLWGALRPVHGTIGWLFNALGQASLLAEVSAATLTLLVPGLVVAATFGGTTAVALALLAEMVAATFALVVLASTRLGISLTHQWRVLRPVAVAAPVAWLGSRLVAEGSSHLPEWARLGASAGSGALAYLLVVVALDRTVLRRSARQLRRMGGGAARGVDTAGDPERSVGVSRTP